MATYFYIAYIFMKAVMEKNVILSAFVGGLLRKRSNQRYFFDIIKMVDIAANHYKVVLFQVLFYFLEYDCIGRNHKNT